MAMMFSVHLIAYLVSWPLHLPICVGTHRLARRLLIIRIIFLHKDLCPVIVLSFFLVLHLSHLPLDSVMPFLIPLFFHSPLF